MVPGPRPQLSLVNRSAISHQPDMPHVFCSWFHLSFQRSISRKNRKERCCQQRFQWWSFQSSAFAGSLSVLVHLEFQKFELETIIPSPKKWVPSKRNQASWNVSFPADKHHFAPLNLHGWFWNGWFWKMATTYRILFPELGSTSTKIQGMVVWVALESLHHAAIAVVPGQWVCTVGSPCLPWSEHRKTICSTQNLNMCQVFH